MAERPILFSAPMVKAILDGRKTQTRRVVKLLGANCIEERAWETHFLQSPWPWSPQADEWLACPYGAPSDRLWVRETWKVSSESNHYPTDEKRLYVQYRAGAVAGTGQLQSKFSVERDVELARSAWSKGASWRPSIHMPRWASRITLEVTGVRVERLCDISEFDAIAEGVEPVMFGVGRWRDYMPEREAPAQTHSSARESFLSLWGSLNGTASLASNPWVWVVNFKRVEEVSRG